MAQVDPELFDRGQFQAELALKASPIAAFKKAIRHAQEVLDSRFRSGGDVRRLVDDRAWFTDQILREAWDRLDWCEDADIALLAVGGYGRGELHPYSDIDLLILLDSADHETFREPIERFLTLLWDIGLEVGQSVRSVDECAEEARADLTVVTNLMESRTIAGPERLLAELAQPVLYRSAPLTVTISIGVALFPQHAQQFSGLYKAADEALYRSKAGGRSGSSICGEDGPDLQLDVLKLRHDY